MNATVVPSSERAERRAAPKPAARWRDPSTGRLTSALAPSGDRLRHSADEGQT